MTGAVISVLYWLSMPTMICMLHSQAALLVLSGAPHNGMMSRTYLVQLVSPARRATRRTMPCSVSAASCPPAPAASSSSSSAPSSADCASPAACCAGAAPPLAAAVPAVQESKHQPLCLSACMHALGSIRELHILP